MRSFVFNFLASIVQYIRVPICVDDWITNGCEKYTPLNSRWRDEPMF